MNKSALIQLSPNSKDQKDFKTKEDSIQQREKEKQKQNIQKVKENDTILQNIENTENIEKNSLFKKSSKINKQNKQNKPPKSNRFQSCQNFRGINNKLQTYKYQKNILISTTGGNNFLNSYQSQQFSNYENNSNQNQNQNQNQKKDDAINLCQLWQKLGNEEGQQCNDQQKIQKREQQQKEMKRKQTSNINELNSQSSSSDSSQSSDQQQEDILDVSQKNQCLQKNTLAKHKTKNIMINSQQQGQNNFSKQKQYELTEQQLLQCFGDSNREDNIEDNKDDRQNRINQRQLQQNKNSSNSNSKQIDEELLDIWNQQQEEEDQVNQLHDKQQKNQSNNKEYYCWEQQYGSPTQRKQYKNSIIEEKNQYKKKQTQYFELQDPNNLDLKKKVKIGKDKRMYQNTSKKQESSSINQQQQNTFSQTLQQRSKCSQNNVCSSRIQNNQLQKQDMKHVENKGQSEADTSHHNQNQHQNHNQNQNQHNLTIVQQIKLQNNHKNMIKLIPNRDYKIFNPKVFALSSFKTDTYSYFGVKARTILPPSSLTKNKNLENNHLSELASIFSLYCFQTQQSILQLKQQRMQQSYLNFLAVKKQIAINSAQKVSKRVVQYNTLICFKIRISSTQQHIATLFLKQIKDGILYDLRLFDEYQKIHSDPIVLIEVKDGYANQCCYCDTNVFLEKKYNYSNNSNLYNNSVNINNKNNYTSSSTTTAYCKQSTSSSTSPSNNKGYSIQQKNQCQISKLKMILNIKNGKLTANMGINGIESSPYNCCLQNINNNKFVYLLGLLIEEKQNNTKNKSKSEQRKMNNDSSRDQSNTNIFGVQQASRLSRSISPQQTNLQQSPSNQQQAQKEDQQLKHHHQNNNSFIIKIGEGVSPLVGLVIAASRKIYIDSFQ